MIPRLFILINGDSPIPAPTVSIWQAWWKEHDARLLGCEVAGMKIELRFLPAVFGDETPAELFEVRVWHRDANNSVRHRTYAEALADYTHTAATYANAPEIRARQAELEKIEIQGRKPEPSSERSESPVSRLEATGT